MNQSPKWQIKPFKELSAQELYEVLRLRSEVFVVEQNCVYQDIDGKDQKAMHLIGTLSGEIIAYARLFAPGNYFEDASIGRVVVAPEARGQKWGHALMSEAISGIHVFYNTHRITISAQLYLQEFYQSHGFVVVGEGYLEDDIPHVRMTLN